MSLGHIGVQCRKSSKSEEKTDRSCKRKYGQLVIVFDNFARRSY